MLFIGFDFCDDWYVGSEFDCLFINYNMVGF